MRIRTTCSRCLDAYVSEDLYSHNKLHMNKLRNIAQVEIINYGSNLCQHCWIHFEKKWLGFEGADLQIFLYKQVNTG